jgi:hypothetical protein
MSFQLLTDASSSVIKDVARTFIQQWFIPELLARRENNYVVLKAGPALMSRLSRSFLFSLTISVLFGVITRIMSGSLFGALWVGGIAATILSLLSAVRFSLQGVASRQRPICSYDLTNMTMKVYRRNAEMTLSGVKVQCVWGSVQELTTYGGVSRFKIAATYIVGNLQNSNDLVRIEAVRADYPQRNIIIASQEFATLTGLSFEEVSDIYSISELMIDEAPLTPSSS